jgi:hypothetical protein
MGLALNRQQFRSIEIPEPSESFPQGLSERSLFFVLYFFVTVGPCFTNIFFVSNTHDSVKQIENQRLLFYAVFCLKKIR